MWKNGFVVWDGRTHLGLALWLPCDHEVLPCMQFLLPPNPSGTAAGSSKRQTADGRMFKFDGWTSFRTVRLLGRVSCRMQGCFGTGSCASLAAWGPCHSALRLCYAAPRLSTAIRHASC